MILQVAVVYLPGLQTIFKTVSLGMNEWLVIVLAAGVLMIVIEGMKVVTMKEGARLMLTP